MSLRCPMPVSKYSRVSKTTSKRHSTHPPLGADFASGNACPLSTCPLIGLSLRRPFSTIFISSSFLAHLKAAGDNVLAKIGKFINLSVIIIIKIIIMMIILLIILLIISCSTYVEFIIPDFSPLR